MLDPALSGPKRVLHVLLLVLLPTVLLAQPAVALLATTGPGAEWIELGEDECGTSCCCPPADCPCEVAPRVPADAPLPQFAPEVSIETSGASCCSSSASRTTRCAASTTCARPPRTALRPRGACAP